MSEKIPTEKLEEAFEFIRIANESGGYMICGEKYSGVPFVGYFIINPQEYTHLPEESE